jgi:hypothetical protein
MNGEPVRVGLSPRREEALTGVGNHESRRSSDLLVPAAWRQIRGRSVGFAKRYEDKIIAAAGVEGLNLRGKLTIATRGFTEVHRPLAHFCFPRVGQSWATA